MLEAQHALKEFIGTFQNALLRNMIVPVEDRGFVVSEARLAFYAEIRFSFRPQLVDSEVLEDLWMNKIRADKDITDFILGLEAEMGFYASEDLVVLENSLISMLANSHPWKYEDKTELTKKHTLSVRYDEDFMDTLLAPAEAREALGQFPWLRVLLLMRLTNYESILSVVQQRPPSREKG